jgi:hypothetical protein
MGKGVSLFPHRTVTVAVRCAISFLFWHIRPLVLGGNWRTGHCPVHTEQSSAPCRPLLLATRRPRIARPTVALATVWLTGRSGAPPDSPVNYSHTPPNFSREQPVHRRPAWRTGHCPVSGAPPDSPVCQAELDFGSTQPSLLQFFLFLFLALRQTILVLKTIY